MSLSNKSQQMGWWTLSFGRGLGVFRRVWSKPFLLHLHVPWRARGMATSPNSGTDHAGLESLFVGIWISTEAAALRSCVRGWESVVHLPPDLGNPRVEAALAASKLPSSDLLQLNKSFRFLFPWGSPSCLQISRHGTPLTINNGRILLLCFPWKKPPEYIKELSPSSTLSYSASGVLFLALQTWLQDNDDTFFKCLQFQILKKQCGRNAFVLGCRDWV